MYRTLPNTFVQAEVIGEKINQGGGYGLESPVSYHFYGHKKGVNWFMNGLDPICKSLEMDIKHYLSSLMKEIEIYLD